MIGNYRDEDTERLAAGGKVRLWEPFRQQAEKRLRILDAATSTLPRSIPTVWKP
jgi:toxin HigB-1